MNKLEFYRTAVHNLGTISTLRMQLQRRFSPSVMKLTSKMLDFPVSARQGTSDLHVFHQIFVQHEYRCLSEANITGLVIDLGANVGYSSAYFLSRFSKCYVLAVEPDPSNYAALIENLKPYTGRYKAFQAAAWPHQEKLRLDPTSTRRGDEWGRKVLRAGDLLGDRFVDAISVPQLIELSGYDRVSLLKIDIEGAEKELFRVGADKWIDKVDNIVIELHGSSAVEIFHGATKSQNFSLSRCDELTVCVRPPAQ